MNRVGIEAINIYSGQLAIDVASVFQLRNLDSSRLENLLMHEKSVAMPFEDVVTFACNAAHPILNAMSESEKQNIELVIVGSESGIDFGKSISNYVHHNLSLNKAARVFETKQACYAGTAALHMAMQSIVNHPNPDCKALVICADVAKPAINSYVEPSQGVGAVAMLIGREPKLLDVDLYASGLHSFHVMDTFRPVAEEEAGDIDLSLLSYLDCFQLAFANYCEKVADTNFFETFDQLAFHTPFAGMVQGAHRNMLRKLQVQDKEFVKKDFDTRVLPGLKLCQRVGNIYTATTYLSLISTILTAKKTHDYRVGIFSYGSGCCSEFYSGIVPAHAHDHLAKLQIEQQFDQRMQVSTKEYDDILLSNRQYKFGMKDFSPQISDYQSILAKQFIGKGLFILKEINNYERIYEQV